jgi:hypothetical protein
MPISSLAEAAARGETARAREQERRAMSKRLLFAGLLLPWLLLPLGCSGVGGPNVVHLTDQRFPPRPVIEQLRSEPGRPYDAIAEFSYRSSRLTRAEVEALFAEQARQLGADAVLLYKRELGPYTRAIPQQSHEESYRYHATAIRYR